MKLIVVNRDTAPLKSLRLCIHFSQASLSVISSPTFDSEFYQSQASTNQFSHHEHVVFPVLKTLHCHNSPSDDFHIMISPVAVNPQIKLLLVSVVLFNNYCWMRLSIIWRIMEIGEGVEAKADNTLLDLHNSSDDTKAEFNNWFIIHSK